MIPVLPVAVNQRGLHRKSMCEPGAQLVGSQPGMGDSDQNRTADYCCGSGNEHDVIQSERVLPLARKKNAQTACYTADHVHCSGTDTVILHGDDVKNAAEDIPNDAAGEKPEDRGAEFQSA